MSRREPAWRRYLRLLGPDPRADVDDELRFHLEELERAFVARGMSTADARRAAETRFGNVEPRRRQLHARSSRTLRRVARGEWWLGLGDDLRMAFRKLVHQPVFALSAIVMLALGISANTAVFSVVNGVLLRPLAYPDPQRLYLVREIVDHFRAAYPTFPANLRSFRAWQTQVQSFEQVAIAESRPMVLSGDGDPALIQGVRSSAMLFGTLGVTPQLGRTFRSEEDDPGHDHEVILTDAAWRGRFHADPGIVGGSIVLDGQPYTVVGVLPASFHFPGAEQLGPLTHFGARVEFFTPLGLDAKQFDPLGEFDFAAIARLKPGVTAEHALAELNVVQGHIARDAGRDAGDLRAALWPLDDQVVGSSRTGLLLLLGGVGAVLVLVCVNLANLLLARVPERLHEAAIRAALGASRARLIRQLLAESMLVAVLGGMLGIAATWLALHALLAFAPATLPRLDEVQIDGRVLAFAVGVTLATGLLFGALPAWRIGQAAGAARLKAGRARVGETATVRRWRQSLIGFEVGISTLLLIAGALLTISLLKVLHVDAGFRSDHVLAADLTIPPLTLPNPTERRQFIERTIRDIGSVPGVATVGWISKLPLTGETSVSDISIPGQPTGEPVVLANYRLVSGPYFHVFGIPVRAGRVFDESDRGRKVVLISESVARHFWPGQSPVGRTIHTSWGTDEDQEVIGVVGDLRNLRLDGPPTLMVFIPDWAPPMEYATGSGSLVIRTSLPPLAIAAEVRQIVHSIDPAVPVTALRPMDDVVSGSVAGRRFQASLAIAFAGTALFLAAFGIFGVVAYSIEQRRRDLGIRLALGARPATLRWMVVRQGMTPVAVGLITGVAGSIVAGHFLGPLLFGVDPHDPVAIAVVVLIVLLAAGFACYLPGARATRIDPMAACRSD
ncbi:MAG TPA: ABC transporter permease [Gemmatimonadales bacterium]|jgi:putative ABC transport system permease protein